MNDLISRQAAIDAMMALKAEDDELYGCSIPESFDSERAVEALVQLPSAQPEQICIAKVTLTDEQVKDAFENAKAQILAAQPERKTGRWIHKSEKLAPLNTIWWYECSACGHHAFNGMITDYCPNCGAKMEVEHDN